MGEKHTGSIRKERSDKKNDVKPTVPIELANCIARLSYVTDTPMQHVIEHICDKGIISRNVLEYLSSNFQNTVRLNNTLFIGGMDRDAIPKRDMGDTQRISTRLSKMTHENIHTLAYALKVSHSRATTVLIDATIKETDIANVFVRTYLSKELNDSRMAELKKLLRYINSNSPSEDQYSWFVFLSNFYDEIKDTATTVKDSLHGFIDKWKAL